MLVAGVPRQAVQLRAALVELEKARWRMGLRVGQLLTGAGWARPRAKTGLRSSGQVATAVRSSKERDWLLVAGQLQCAVLPAPEKETQPVLGKET